MRLKVPRLLRSTHTRQAPLKGDVLMSHPKSTRIVVSTVNVSTWQQRCACARVRSACAHAHSVRRCACGALGQFGTQQGRPVQCTVHLRSACACAHIEDSRYHLFLGFPNMVFTACERRFCTLQSVPYLCVWGGTCIAGAAHVRTGAARAQMRIP